jgi:hypothetical protein
VLVGKLCLAEGGCLIFGGFLAGAGEGRIDDPDQNGNVIKESSASSNDFGLWILD